MDLHTLLRTKQILRREEGYRTHLYQDTKGIWTVGVGYNIEEKGLPEDVIMDLLKRTVDEAEEDARRLPEFGGLDSVRKGVLVRMVFQMGLGSVRRFSRMRAALQAGDYPLAAREMLDSRWFREDSPARAAREAEIMKTGRYLD